MVLPTRWHFARVTAVNSKADFTPAWGCLSRILIFHQLIETHHKLGRPTVLASVNSIGAFSSTDRIVLFGAVHPKGMPETFVSLQRTLYLPSCSHVKI